MNKYLKQKLKQKLIESLETQNISQDTRSTIQTPQSNNQQYNLGTYNYNFPKIDIQQTDSTEDGDDIDLGTPSWNPDILNGSPTYLDSEGRPIWITTDSDGQIIIIVEISPGVFIVYHNDYYSPNYYNPDTNHEIIPGTAPEGYQFHELYPNWKPWNNPSNIKPPPGGEDLGNNPNWYEDIINDALQGYHPMDWRVPGNPGRWDWNWYINQPNLWNM